MLILRSVKLRFPYVKLNYSKRYASGQSAAEIRNKFIDFFVTSHGHTFVRSSSVVPYNDPSLAFVNAGMNQFKSVFLGHSIIPHPRVVNSQKCIRVGGKHNDLDAVGKDGYHHTFFEMLGSWSFNDYFKVEACQMAWQLLTREYKISPSKLYVTYFGGDEQLDLPADLECKEIWLSLGVAEEHILPFGMRENFWEMGSIGPCGPCSEIHVNKSDLLSPEEARKLVNKGCEEVVEIWNLVFMQYNRLVTKELNRLPSHHVDTGMGLERLVAFLQNKKTNYETDLFQPLIETIHQVAGGDPYGNNYEMETAQGKRDWAYRVLADHARMITVALADGAFPENNHRLRRVIRQALAISRNYFNKNGLLMTELSSRVVEMFGNVYPELSRNLDSVHSLLNFEEQIFDDWLSKLNRQCKEIIDSFPDLYTLQPEQQTGLLAGLRQLENWTIPVIPGELAFKLYETYGLQEESLQLLAGLKNLSINWDEYNECKAMARKQTLQNATKDLNVNTNFDQFNLPSTESIYKYDFIRFNNGEYDFPPLDAKLMAIMASDGTSMKFASAADGEIIMMSNQSNFYTEAGGQIGDTGRVICPTGSARVTRVRQSQGYIFHHAVVTRGFFQVNHPIQFHIDAEDRLNCMANHTATHLLQAGLKKLLKVTCQKSSHVSADYLRFDFGIFQTQLDPNVIAEVERLVRDLIRRNVPVVRFSMHLHEASTLDHVTFVPGETYPDVVHIVKVESPECDIISVEPCCGTHVTNTADIKEFAIVSVKSSGLGNRSIKAVTRQAAIEAHQLGDQVMSSLHPLEKSIAQLTRPCNGVPAEWVEQLKVADRSLREIKQMMENGSIPFVVDQKAKKLIEKLESAIRLLAQEGFSRLMQTQVKEALEINQNQPFLVHILDIPRDLLSIGKAKMSLIKATRHCSKKPVLILAVDEDDFIVARCTVPQQYVKSEFDAEKWTECLTQSLGGRSSAPKGQDARYVCNFRGRKFDSESPDQTGLLKDAAQSAVRFATGVLQQNDQREVSEGSVKSGTC